jgi:exocyst complex component 8
MMSSCVRWAKEQVEDFNAILSRQLSTVEPTSQTWKLCMERAHLHAAKLSEVGLDFRILIDQAG